MDKTPRRWQGLLTLRKALNVQKVEFDPKLKKEDSLPLVKPFGS